MAIKTKEQLKQLFQSGDKPTEQDFTDLIDSLVSFSDTPPVGTFVFQSPTDFSTNGSIFDIGIKQPVGLAGLELGMESGNFVDTCDGSLFINPISTGKPNGSGFFTLGPGVSPVRFGTGADGDVTISSAKNINADILANGRTVADGVSYSVIGLGTDTAVCSIVPAGIGINDAVLLINLQGTSSGYSNVGNYEELTVKNITSNTITFNEPIARNYGNSGQDNIGTSTTNQRVILQRIPQYNNLTIEASGSLTCNAWNGISGGVLAFRCKNIFTNSGTITTQGKGYRSIPQTSYGEGYKGYNVQGGGNSGPGNGYPSGAGHATSGGTGSTGTPPGSAYGIADLSLLLMGAACECNNNGHNMIYSNGGGILYMSVKQTVSLGTINCNAAPASEYVGGGAGGSIFIVANALNYGVHNLTATGATGQNGCGSGSAGRIALMYGTISGSQVGSPIANVNTNTGISSEAFLLSTNLVEGKNATGYNTFRVKVDSIPATSTVTAKFSNDGSIWTSDYTLSVGDNTIDISTLGFSDNNFYYRIDMTGDGYTTPTIDQIELEYSPARFYTTDQAWNSKILNNVAVTPTKPLSVIFSYQYITGNSVPKFQLIGSDSIDMSAPDIYPAPGEYYQENGEHSILSGNKLFLSVPITTQRKYWRVKTVLNSGSSYNHSPGVTRIDLELP